MRTPKTIVSPGWKEIEPLGWGTWSNDFRAVGRLMWKLYSHQTIIALRHFVNVRVSEIYGAVEQYEKVNVRRLSVGRDDGFSDVAYHVVGMGEEEFNKVMLDSTLMERRYNADYKSPDGYAESFAYCFHSDRY